MDKGTRDRWNLRGKNATPKDFWLFKIKSFSRAYSEYKSTIDSKPSRLADKQHRSSANRIWLIKLFPTQHPARNFFSVTYSSVVRLHVLHCFFLSNLCNNLFYILYKKFSKCFALRFLANLNNNLSYILHRKFPICFALRFLANLSNNLPYTI